MDDEDYDCFYASVFENENPALKSVPLVSPTEGFHVVLLLTPLGCATGNNISDVL